MTNKQTVFSGIQPTGTLHIGNYLGAIKQWLELQKTHNCIYCIVDYHAITVPYDPKTMQQRILDTALDYFALGLDPKKSTVFVQSHVPEHTELTWLLNTIAPFGELRKMTQWKDKSLYSIKNIDTQKTNELLLKIENSNIYYNAALFAHLENLGKSGKLDNDNKLFNDKYNKKIIELRNELVHSKDFMQFTQYLNTKYDELLINHVKAGLLNYPLLMAADILLYKTSLVPVGEDQKQHVELTRTIARKFNNQFGDLFPIPESKTTATKRIMSLADPTKKMSKSLGQKHYLALTDTPEIIREKVSKAVTGVGTEKSLPAGTKNLLLLLKEFGTAKDYVKFEESTNNGTVQYSELKKALAESIITHLKPFQKKRAELTKNPKKIWKSLEEGAKKAQPIATQTLTEVKEKMGLV
ncbi:tryptophan--tRNA ligase [Patescibacteria group bacterium]|nr:tryptophan--tRNA ligase [Patescibacteria group bacterium]MBU1890235.1 tryptophan--tRNA ligase [Patescibacteria group bacterium]